MVFVKMCLWYQPYRLGKAEFFQSARFKNPPLIFLGGWRRKRTTRRQTMVLRIFLCDHWSKRLSWKLSVKTKLEWFPKTTLRGFGSQVVCVTHSCYITWAAWALVNHMFLQHVWSNNFVGRLAAGLFYWKPPAFWLDVSFLPSKGLVRDSRT